MEGKFIITLRDGEGDVLEVRTVKNTFVNDGKEFTLDHMFGIRNWFDPGVNTTTWSDMSKRYMAIGDSTDVADGAVSGPTTTSGVDVTGPWQGVDPDDSRLASEIARKELVAARALGSTNTTLYAIFGDPELGTGQVSIHEVGVFLGSGANMPAGDPTLIESYRPEAMMVRAVLYSLSGTQWFADPIVRAPGSEITVTHTFGDLDF